MVGLLLAAVSIEAADPRFKHLSVREGLSHSSVHAIVQDHEGFLWLGTLDGLNRFDGYSVEVFRAGTDGDPRMLSAKSVLDLHVDPRGRLWIATDGGGLNRFDAQTRTFRHFQNDPRDPDSLGHDRVSAIAQGTGERLWIGTAGGGTFLFDLSTETFEPLALPGAEASGWLHVEALLQEPSGLLWIGTQDAGLVRYDPATESITPFRHAPQEPSSLAADRIKALARLADGSLWIATDGDGLHRLDPAADGFRRFRLDPEAPLGSSSDHIGDLLVDTRQTLWLATLGGGLGHFDPATGSGRVFQQAQEDPDSLSSNMLYSLYEDRDRLLWVGTASTGAGRTPARTRRFETHVYDPQNPTGLRHPVVRGITESPAGILWIATQGGGLHRLDRATGAFRHFGHDPESSSSLASDFLQPLIHDRDGSLWIGTWGAGLDHFDPETETFRNYRHDPEQPGSLSNDRLTYLLQDPSGVLWIGTWGGGLNRLDPGAETFISYRHDPGRENSLGSDQIVPLLMDKEGFLWIGTWGTGLDRLDPETGTFESYRHRPGDPTSLASNRLQALHEDQAGNLWIGTVGGLDRLDPRTGEIRHYGEDHGLSSRLIYGILADDHNRLWLSTSQGLAHFDPITETAVTYDKFDGLQADDFNSVSFYRSPRGELFFGGIAGFNAFFPQELESPPAPSPVVVTGISKHNAREQAQEWVPPQGEVTFSHRDDVITVEFSTLEFWAPERSLYAYRLEGSMVDWLPLGENRSITFVDIKPGHYTLWVRGRNRSGRWSEGSPALRFQVEPPYWQTWWFRLAAVASFNLLLALLYRLRVRAMKARSQELEGLNTQLSLINQTLEARNAELEAYAHAFAHDLKNPLVTIRNFLGSLEQDLDRGNLSRAQSDLLRVDTASAQLTSLLDDLLAFVRIRPTVSADHRVELRLLLDRALSQLAEPIASQDVTIEIAPDLPEVWCEPTLLQEVFHHLLDNGIKFLVETPEPKISIRAEHRGSETICILTDNGPGIHPDYHQRVFQLFEQLQPTTPGNGMGLAIAKRIVEAHRGRIWIEARETGTEIRFSLPNQE